MDHIFCIAVLVAQPLIALSLLWVCRGERPGLHCLMAGISVAHLVVQVYVFIRHLSDLPEVVPDYGCLGQIEALAMFIAMDLMLALGSGYLKDADEWGKGYRYGVGGFISDLEVLKKKLPDDWRKDRLGILVSKMQYAGPVGNPRAAKVGGEIRLLIEDLKLEDDYGEFCAVCDEIDRKLEIRQKVNLK